MIPRALALLGCVVASSAAACATVAVDYTPLNDSPRPLSARSPESVQIFTAGRPARTFVELGMLESRENGYAESADAYAKMREEAGARGCDALVIVSFVPQSYFAPKGSRATCIVYTDARSDSARPASTAAEPTAPLAGASTCQAAAAHAGEIAKAWARKHPDRAAATPSSRAFVDVCERLPANVRPCLSTSYETMHEASCDTAFRTLPPRTQDQIDDLFLEPAGPERGTF